MAMPLRPQHFVSRQDGTLTALIAVDELPSCITIRSVPRVLNQSDTHGMTSLGTLPSRGQSYVVDYVHQGNSFEVALASSAKGSSDDGAVTAHPQTALYPGWNTNSENQSAPAWRNADSAGREVVKHNAGPRKGNGSSNGSKKEYCSFWLRHGECDYQQQGCIFKHEMPTDVATLEKLGLRDIPRWYREKHGLKSISAGGGDLTRTDRVWRGDGQAASQVAQYNNMPSRYIVPAVSENEGRGRVQYAATMAPGSNRQVPGHAGFQAVSDRDGGENTPLGPQAPASRDARNIHRTADGSQMWKRLDLLTQEELPEYHRAGNGNLAIHDGVTGFGDSNGSVDYVSRHGIPTMSRTSQPISKDSDRAADNSGDGRLRSSKPTDGSIWAIRDSQPHDLSALTITPFGPVPQSANQQNDQNGYGKRKNQRSRRLYQARTAPDNVNANARPASEFGKSQSDKQSDTHSPLGSASPAKQSEKQKVKSKCVSGLDGTVDATSECGKTTDTSSGCQTPDDDPFGLKFD